MEVDQEGQITRDLVLVQLETSELCDGGQCREIEVEWLEGFL